MKTHLKALYELLKFTGILLTMFAVAIAFVAMIYFYPWQLAMVGFAFIVYAMYMDFYRQAQADMYFDELEKQKQEEMKNNS